MAEGKHEKAYPLFLGGIVSGVGTWIALAIILPRLNVSNELALPFASAVAIAVFGAFLFRMYTTYRPRVKVRAASAPSVQAVPESPAGSVSETSTQAPEAPAVKAMPEPRIEHVERCLILAAPTHGVLQDRLNYWLSGNYGTIKSTAMTSTDKGFFMSVIYQESKIPELTEKIMKQLEKHMELTDTREEIPQAQQIRKT